MVMVLSSPFSNTCPESQEVSGISTGIAGVSPSSLPAIKMLVGPSPPPMMETASGSTGFSLTVMRHSTAAAVTITAQSVILKPAFL